MKNLLKNRRQEHGFTLLELLAVLAIIAVVSLFGLPAFQEWTAKRSFHKSVNDIYSELSQARLQAFIKNTTTKVTTSGSGDNYTMAVFYNATAVSNCSTGSGWSSLESTVVSVNTNFQISGTGIGNVCFFRDGTSTGGTYSVTQKDGQSNLGNGVISVILATGFIDVVKN
jgi:prepilin-type N-terminal cleavage/methylation domain-containing protein